MASTKLSILIPLYNEEEYIREILGRVVRASLPPGMSREIIVVDDCSVDGSAELVEDFRAATPEIPIVLLRQPKNCGKGAAIRAAIAAASADSDFCLIQDADLEYDPAEYGKLLAPLVEGKADAVFGSRFLASDERRVLYFWHSLANHILTTLCNIVADVNLTDMETCYKAFRTPLAKSIPIESNRFGIEPEITIKLARRKARIYETAISYHGRTYDEGKKIGLKDAFAAIWAIAHARLSGRIHTDGGHAALDALAAAPKFNAWMAGTIAPWLGDRVLEIGAGSGNMARHLCPRRKRYIATDLDPEHLEQLRVRFRHRPAVEVRKLDAEDPSDFTPFEGQLDTVVCLNVLEHIRDDAGTLRRIRTLLAPGGCLLLLVPNDPAAYGTLDKAVGHFRRYLAPGLTTLLEAAGYDVERVLNFNRVSTPGWRVVGQILKSEVLTPGGMRVFDKFVWLWRRIDSLLPWPPTSIIAVARRNGDMPV